MACGVYEITSQALIWHVRGQQDIISVFIRIFIIVRVSRVLGKHVYLDRLEDFVKFFNILVHE